MSNIDYLKVIGVLSKTLKMETIDIQFPDKSPGKIDVTMGGPSIREKKFRIIIRGFAIELSFPEDYFSPREFEKWRVNFEYELEQVFLMNIRTTVGANAEGHVLTFSL